MKILFLLSGVVFTGLGIVGIATPLLPTTPFLLVAAACFARSSPKFHIWLTSHPRLGPPIEDWQKSGCIRKPAKVLATILIVVNAAFPVFVIQGIVFPVRIAVVVVMASVLIFIWTRPSIARS
ncbi:MAG: YbaN family protein [Proteobacteria bacterium]|nr:YbaN family protein [Pseudomonadota bacterium]